MPDSYICRQTVISDIDSAAGNYIPQGEHND